MSNHPSFERRMSSNININTIRIVFSAIGALLIVLQFTYPHTYTVRTETKVPYQIAAPGETYASGFFNMVSSEDNYILDKWLIHSNTSFLGITISLSWLSEGPVTGYIMNKAQLEKLQMYINNPSNASFTFEYEASMTAEQQGSGSIIGADFFGSISTVVKNDEIYAYVLYNSLDTGQKVYKATMWETTVATEPIIDYRLELVDIVHADNFYLAAAVTSIFLGNAFFFFASMYPSLKTGHKRGESLYETIIGKLKGADVVIDLCSHLQELGIQASILNPKSPEALPHKPTLKIFGNPPLGTIKLNGRNIDLVELYRTVTGGKKQRYIYVQQYIVRASVDADEIDLKAELEYTKKKGQTGEASGMEWVGGRLAGVLAADTKLKELILVAFERGYVSVSPNRKGGYVSIWGGELMRQKGSFELKVGGVDVPPRNPPPLSLGERSFPTKEEFEVYDRVANHVREVAKPMSADAIETKESGFGGKPNE